MIWEFIDPVRDHVVSIKIRETFDILLNSFRIVLYRIYVVLDRQGSAAYEILKIIEFTLG